MDSSFQTSEERILVARSLGWLMFFNLGPLNFSTTHTLGSYKSIQSLKIHNYGYYLCFDLNYKLKYISNFVPKLRNEKKFKLFGGVKVWFLSKNFFQYQSQHTRNKVPWGTLLGGFNPFWVKNGISLWETLLLKLCVLLKLTNLEPMYQIRIEGT